MHDMQSEGLMAKKISTPPTLLIAGNDKHKKTNVVSMFRMVWYKIRDGDTTP